MPIHQNNYNFQGERNATPFARPEELLTLLSSKYYKFEIPRMYAERTTPRYSPKHVEPTSKPFIHPDFQVLSRENALRQSLKKLNCSVESRALARTNPNPDFQLANPRDTCPLGYVKHLNIPDSSNISPTTISRNVIEHEGNFWCLRQQNDIDDQGHQPRPMLTEQPQSSIRQLNLKNQRENNMNYRGDTRGDTRSVNPRFDSRSIHPQTGEYITQYQSKPSKLTSKFVKLN